MRLMRGRRRIVVGDIHGELDGFREVLKDAGLIDREDNWVGADTILIQTGDAIDRGPHSREAVGLLRRLQKQAALSQGEVVRLCGNHELMLLQGFFHYANFSDLESLAFELKEEIIKGDVRASHTDGERLYTHAGLRSAIREILVSELKSEKPKLKANKIDLFLLSDHINKVFSESVEKDDLGRHPIFHVGPDRGGEDPVGGIFWCDFSSISPSAEAWLIPQIFGHTPTRENKVKTVRGLRLIDVDAGMCRVYGGERVYLEITPEGQVLQHSKARSKWTATLLGKNLSSEEQDSAAVERRRSKSVEAHTVGVNSQTSDSGKRKVPSHTRSETAGPEVHRSPKRYMEKLKKTFRSSFGMRIEPLLPKEELMAIDGNEHEALLFGSQSALKEGTYLVQGDIGRFVESCPEKYFLIGFWGHGINSYAFYYVKNDPNWKIFFRLPYGGVYMDNEKCSLFIKDFMANFLSFERKYKNIITSFTAVNSMGEIYYKTIGTGGGEYEVYSRSCYAMIETDFKRIFNFPLIRMPDSLDRVKRLQSKLNEYRQRLDDIEHGDPGKKKQLLEDTSYKIRLLETLLLEGEVHTCRLWEELGCEGGRDLSVYVDACAVIYDYCRNGGKKVKGGTGL
jgi:hypothetical protein